MKREEIKAILPDITDEQLGQILNLNGADIEKAKGKTKDLEEEVRQSKEAYEKLKTEFDNLNANNASADEWKNKYETLQKEYQEKEQEAQRKSAEKIIEQRFNSALGEREFNHPAIQADYFKKFAEEVAKSENIGKADVDILENLIKDDATAIKNITVQNLPKPTYKDGKKYSSIDEIMKISNDKERREAIAENAELFNLDLGGN